MTSFLLRWEWMFMSMEDLKKSTQLNSGEDLLKTHKDSEGLICLVVSVSSTLLLHIVVILYLGVIAT
jgi:hypothetical protein